MGAASMNISLMEVFWVLIMLRLPIGLVPHTPGGLVWASVQIARAVNRRMGKGPALVPHYAMSGRTLFALAPPSSTSPESVLPDEILRRDPLRGYERRANAWARIAHADACPAKRRKITWVE
jgi:hypothetical protein